MTLDTSYLRQALYNFSSNPGKLHSELSEINSRFRVFRDQEMRLVKRKITLRNEEDLINNVNFVNAEVEIDWSDPDKYITAGFDAFLPYRERIVSIKGLDLENAPFLPELFEISPGLQSFSLDIKAAERELYERLMANIPVGLKDLQLLLYGDDTVYVIINEILARCGNLQAFSIDCSLKYLRLDTTLLRNLKGLSIFSTLSEDDLKSMRPILESLKSLKELTIYSRDIYGTDVSTLLSETVSSMEDLEKFRFINVNHAQLGFDLSRKKYKGLRIVSKSIKGITIDLQNFSEVNLDTPNLTTIGMCISHEVDQLDQILEILDSTPSIKEVELHYHPNRDFPRDMYTMARDIRFKYGVSVKVLPLYYLP
jgi:hypothetical protein